MCGLTNKIPLKIRLEPIKKELPYIICALIAVVFSFLVHEFAHWTMGEILGYKMVMTLNVAYPLPRFFNKDWHYTLVSAVGPLVTLLQSLVFYLLIKVRSRKTLYPFLFSAFYLELLSGIMNLRHPNDLGRISESFGIGLLTIPVIFILVHFFLVYKTSTRERYSIKFNLLTLLWVLIFSSAWILTNNKFHVILLSR